MEAIKLESNVGQCGIRIACQINAEKLLGAAKALIGFLLWHNIASAIFGGGKKAEFKREDGYSDAMGAKARKAAIEVLSKFFDNVEIETFGKAKLSDEEKFIKNALEIGFSEAEAKAGWTAYQSRQQKPAEVEAAKPEEKIS